jgi:hypothetical protein
MLYRIRLSKGFRQMRVCASEKQILRDNDRNVARNISALALDNVFNFDICQVLVIFHLKSLEFAC